MNTIKVRKRGEGRKHGRRKMKYTILFKQKEGDRK